MKTLYLECHSGVSGDMLLGALVDLGCPLEKLNDEIAKLGFGGLRLESEQVSKRGIAATKVNVIIESDAKLKHWRDVRDLLEQVPLSEKVKTLATSAMKQVALAESKIHSAPLEKVHFHELGSLDTIADVVGVCAAIEFFGFDGIHCSPVAVGAGTVNIAHGVVPNPAPATLEILRGMQLDMTPLEGERATPTGAALLKTLTGEYATDASAISGELTAIGYGAGSADFSDRTNVLRASVYQRQDSTLESDTVSQIEATIDDMNPQLFGHVFERLYGAGCLEAFVAPLTMKKSRPGWNLTVLCEPAKVRALAMLIIDETTTSGVRYQELKRLKAPREIIEVNTKYGAVKVKKIQTSSGFRHQPEYDSCVEVARIANVTLNEVYEAVQMTNTR